MSTDNWAIIDAKSKAFRTCEAVVALRASGVEPILLKGWSLARHYPFDSPRRYTDIDLAVAPEEYPAASRHLAEAKLKTPVDLHGGLGHLDDQPWDDVFARTELVPLNDRQIRVLCHADALRVTSTHWLWDGGIYREKLWDIFYLVQNLPADFDWATVESTLSPVRRTWLQAAIATARDHLELDVSSLPADYAEFRLPRWYEMTLEREWRLGPYPRIPLKFCWRDPKLLREYLHRRFPPNRIASTIEVEAPIDDTSRMPVQARSVLKKIRSRVVR